MNLVCFNFTVLIWGCKRFFELKMISCKKTYIIYKLRKQPTCIPNNEIRTITRFINKLDYPTEHNTYAWIKNCNIIIEERTLFTGLIKIIKYWLIFQNFYWQLKIAIFHYHAVLRVCYSAYKISVLIILMTEIYE